MRVSRLLVVGALASVFACGAPPPPAAPPPVAAAPPPPAARAVAAPEDTSPVAAPPSLAFTATIRNADALQGAVRDLAGATFPILQALTAETLAQTALGAALGGAVDLRQSVDLAYTADNTFAVSLALAAGDASSLDDVKQALGEDFDLAPHDGGVVGLTPHKGGGKAGLRCEIRPAAGAAPYRLVCAKHATGLRALAPYLARTVAREPSSTDVRFRVFPGAFSQADIPKDTPAVFTPLFQNFIETFADVAEITVGASVGDPGVDVRVQVPFRGAKSPFTRIALAQSKEAKPLPDLFWRLPGDALAAVYARGADVADLDGLRKVVADGLGQSWRDDGYGEEVVARGMKAILSLVLTGGPLSVAYGFDAPAATATLATPAPKRSALHGWTLFGVEEPASRWTDGLREMIAVDKIPWKPSPKAAASHGPTETELVEITAKNPKLPPHTAHFAFRTFPWGKRKPKPVPTSVLHVAIVPDGTRTWIALGEDEALLAAKVKGVLAANGGLGARTDLQALHAPTGFAGFVTPGLVDAFRIPDDASDLADARTSVERLAVSPAAEATPIVFLLPEPAGSASEVELRLAAPADAVRTILAHGQ